MMRGWSLPLSESGLSALVPAPPWHFSGDVIAIEFRVDPGRLAALLPPWLDPLPNGSCAFVFCDWCAAADSDPRLQEDPARGQYKEAYVAIDVTYEGNRAARISQIWVDSDLSLVRGLVQGFPKKFGSVYMTRSVEVGRGGVRRQPGSRFAAHVSMLGQRLAKGTVVLDREHQPPVYPPGVSRPLIHTRLLPSLAGETPTVYERTRGAITDFEVGRTFSGEEASLELGSSEFEELELVSPADVGPGWVFSVGYTVTGGSEEPLARDAD